MRLTLNGTHKNCRIAKDAKECTVILIAPQEVVDRLDNWVLEDETDDPGPLRGLQAGCVYEVTITEWWGYEEYYVRISDVRQVL